MQAIHGGQATHDPIDAQNIAVRRRGGMVPQASVAPAAMRATRDLLRRRRPLMRHRAEWLPHGQQTNPQETLPAFSKNRASTANRAGLAARFADPAVQQNSAVDLALMGYDAQRLNDVERSIVRTAKQHAPAPFSQRHSVPGSGKLLRLGRLADIPASRRCPRGQDVVSDGRLVTCANASAGTRDGASGTKMGHASRPWAFAEAADLFLRDHPAGQQERTSLETPQGQGTALTVLAHT